MTFHDHFSTRAETYARARPTYPDRLFEELAKRTSQHDLAWDSGTGNGQAAIGLATHFTQVVATDPSEAQLREVTPHPRIIFRRGREAESGLDDHVADLVTAAQAAHWFDLPAFYQEARRVLKPNGLIAMWSYGVCRLGPELDSILHPFYYDTVGPYWPPERAHVDSGYRDLPFPFESAAFPEFSIERDWTLEEFLEYVHTWSAVNRYIAAKGGDPVEQLGAVLRPRWRNPQPVVWPISVRSARVP
ncbi:MAG TPA: class I SAM-dependent methyltransferase [Gemmatimonadales bacterium]|nr:class I SAM-dependent methyltransferase [Gemmatimonadales bacterium]